MKKLRHILLIATFLILVGLLWIFRPSEKPSEQNISASLSMLSGPYKKVQTYHYEDGGSLGIKIEGNKGKIFMACFSAPFGKASKYQKLYIGATHYSEKSARETQNHDSKLRLLEILRERSSNKLQDDYCIAKASNRWSDYARIIWKRYFLKVKNYTILE